MGSIAQPSLPIIDFSKENLKKGTYLWSSTCVDVLRALEEYGYFIATYDKVSLDLHDAIFKASKELFELPTETKMKNTSETPTHGYVGQLPIIPLYESLGIENATTLEGAKAFTNLMWPLGNEFFLKKALSFSKIMAELDEMVMRMVSESYGIENDYEMILGSTTYLLKFIKYLRPQNNKPSLGIVSHTDKSFMSILHPMEVKGLEIKTKEDQWIVVEPSSSSFVVMAGDVCTAWTNGRIESAIHRVVVNQERYSIGFFSFIRDLIVPIPNELVDEEHPLKYKPFDHYKFIHYYVTEEGRRSKCPIRDFCGI